MPRADPTRSAYCASRHLLRNLDDAGELRRNPLVRGCFPPSPDDDAVDALARVRGLVHASLARCRDRTGARAPGTLGRMHAALLRCDIDRQPLSVVAREIGLSDRQIRRERRAAHEAFLAAFERAKNDPAPAIVREIARVRIARASDLHAFGQSALALAACEELVANAAPARRVEALCLAAEIERELGRYAEASARAGFAAAEHARLAGAMSDADRTVAAEHVDFTRWSLHRELGLVSALGMQPPSITANAAAADPRDEPRYALLLHALAAYADQRWEVGDRVKASETIARAWRLLPHLARDRAKERLAVMLADARVLSLYAYDDHASFLAAERAAEASGHVGALVIARAERIGTEMQSRGGDQLYTRAVRTLDVSERTMPRTVGIVCALAMQVEPDPRVRAAATEVALRIFPPHGALGLLARLMRSTFEFDIGDIEAARTHAFDVRNDAEAAGNARVRGGAERVLAWIAYAEQRRRDAVRHLDVALPVLERYGTRASHGDAVALARRIERARPRTFLSANIVRLAAR